MGLFSDEDINEAERAIEEALQNPYKALTEDDKKRIRLEFLKGFEEAYVRIKKENRPFPLGQISVALIMEHLKADITKEPKKFGYGIGALVGALKFYPKYILGDTNTMFNFTQEVKYLRDKKPEQYPIIEKRLKRWKKKIKSIIGELTEQERKNYIEILRTL